MPDQTPPAATNAGGWDQPPLPLAAATVRGTYHQPTQRPVLCVGPAATAYGGRYCFPRLPPFGRNGAATAGPAASAPGGGYCSGTAALQR